MDKDYLKIGVVTSTHGVHGEVKVFPTTDEPKRYKKLKTVTLYKNGKEKTVTVKSVKFFKNQVILGFEEIDDMDSAYELRTSEIRIPRSEGIALGDGEYFIRNINEMKISDDTGRDLGKVNDIITTAANDVYEVKTPEGKTIMIPAIHECILYVDTEAGEMKVHLLPGLEDL